MTTVKKKTHTHKCTVITLSIILNEELLKILPHTYITRQGNLLIHLQKQLLRSII